VLLRILLWHGDMVRKKREWDRRRKRQASAKNRSGKSPIVVSLESDLADTREQALPDIQDIAGFLRRERQAHCACETTDGWGADFSDSKLENGLVRWIDQCRKCGHRETPDASVDELYRAAEELPAAADDSPE
jgi:hypothetical protein